MNQEYTLHPQKKYPSHLVTAALLTLALLVVACSTPAPETPSSGATVPPSPANTSAAGALQPTTAAGQTEPTAPDPACTSPAAPTQALTEGPYFTPGSPERASLLEPGMAGTQFILTGYVLTTDCQPVANARLDFWQADAAGNYDNVGYTLRGHQYSDEKGYYQLTTVVPGLYPGRTEHIHFKVQAPDGSVLTSQLFFPGSTSNTEDGIYDPSLLITIAKDSDPIQATFNFIVIP